MRRYTILTALALSSLLFACKAKKSTTQNSSDSDFSDNEAVIQSDYDDGIEMDEMIVKPGESESLPQEAPVYKGAETIINDISHTRLEISFDWAKQQAHGKARIEVSPYFKPINTLVLDAQYMDLLFVGEIKGKDTLKLDFTYDSLKLSIDLKSERKKGQSYSIYIDYIANPERVKGEGGKAIQDTKGLYFINTDGEDKEVPMHLWTQGETKHNSCWLPTIDAPNEKFSHEILMTVADTMVTSSNGRLKSSKKIANGMRIDQWVMEKQHSSYLIAMFVGNFEVVNATWNKVPLRYIVDKKYAASAKTIFKNTPEMIEFYSKKLNTPYPWPKYDQAVVHDFISGAMENTTLTIHGDMLMLDTRELLDASYEDVIAHELFHHWFGDLVTCESWANLPLNESFATYGEYLWKEYKYGREEADYHLNNDRINYFNEASSKQVNMIRYDYEKPDDMFDRHSYQKGGLILHMLRNYLGDEAFFQGLNLYLTKFAYQNAEIHDLRKCFETISGEDLVWFFDQWFFHKGHPVLEVQHSYEEGFPFYQISVEQIQDLKENPVFILPLNISFHYGDSVHTEAITIKEVNQSFTFKIDQIPDWVSFDADKSVLARVRENKPFAQWLNQLRVSPLYQDRLDALRQFENADEPEQLELALNYALADKHWNIRSEALGLINSLPPDLTSAYGERVIDMALHHPKSDVRTNAFYALAKMDFSGRGNIVKQGLNDSSYSVNASALTLMYSTDTAAAIAQAKNWSMHSKPALKYTSLGILSEAPGNNIPAFKEVWDSGKPDFYLVYLLINCVKKSDDPAVVIDGLQLMNSFEPSGDQDFLLVLFINQTNSKLQENYQSKIENLESKIAIETDEATKASMVNQKIEYLRVLEYIVVN